MASRWSATIWLMLEPSSARRASIQPRAWATTGPCPCRRRDSSATKLLPSGCTARAMSATSRTRSPERCAAVSSSLPAQSAARMRSSQARAPRTATWRSPSSSARRRAAGNRRSSASSKGASCWAAARKPARPARSMRPSSRLAASRASARMRAWPPGPGSAPQSCRPMAARTWRSWASIRGLLSRMAPAAGGSSLPRWRARSSASHAASIAPASSASCARRPGAPSSRALFMTAAVPDSAFGFFSCFNRDLDTEARAVDRRRAARLKQVNGKGNAGRARPPPC